MKAIVVGYGSIGQRHARILNMMGCDVGVVSHRAVNYANVFSNLIDALDKWKPDYVILANKTHEHYKELSIMAECDFKGMVLVEKPLFDRDLMIPQNQFSCLCVGYNMRFHPLIGKLQDFLQGQRPLSAVAYVGQYLPQWRPSSDYRNSYSARANEGGGVLRDLSHELDYMNWLFGGWQRLTAQGGHFSRLEIGSDDFYNLMLVMKGCPLVSIHINYLDRITHREVIVHTDDHSCKIDFVKGTINIDGSTDSITVDKDKTYFEEHRAVLSRDFSRICSLMEGQDIVKMIECAERASINRTWVEAP